MRECWKAVGALCALVVLVGCDDKGAKEAEGKGGASEAAKIAAPTGAGEKTGEATKAEAGGASALEGMTRVFSMIDNRHMAHQREGGDLVMFMGEASGLKYVQGRWKNPWIDATEEGGERFAYARGPGATIRFPLGRPGDSGAIGDGWKVSAKLRPVGEQRCDVFLKAGGAPEKKIGSLTLSSGWKTYDVKLPADTKAGSEIAVRFHFSRSREIPGVDASKGKSAAAFDWVRVGKGEAGEPGALSKLVDAKARTIALDAERSLGWFTVLAAGTRFTGKVTGEGSLVVRADGNEKTFPLKAGEANVDLSAFADQAVSLELAPKSGGSLSISEPGLVRATPNPSGAPKDGPQVVVVWLIDTLRADHLKAYNPKTDVVTPNLDAFAKESAVFARATVQGNSSLPSSASIFSSLYPPRHGVVKQSAKLPKDQGLLGESMKAAGMKTGLFSSNGYVSNSWGFARGFDSEHNPIREGWRSEAEHLWGKAREWMKAELEKDPKAKLFVYLNTSDPHVPYDPPKEDLERYHKGAGVAGVSPRGTGELLHDLAGGKRSLNAAQHAYMRALYKGEITYNDRWFGVMLEDLEKMGVRDQAMVAVTSDHGEEFGEYKRYGHGISANQELIDVPFIIGYRPWTKSGVRVERAVEMIDMAPTLSAAVGAPAAKGLIQGEDLGDAMRGEEAVHPTAAFAYHNDFLRSARVGDLKYQLFQGDKDPVYELSYGATGAVMAPLDGKDVSGSKPVTRRAMRDLMAFHLAHDEVFVGEGGEPGNHGPAAAKALDALSGW